MDNPPKIIAVSEKIYRKLLRLYPAAHRRDYGEQMAQLFRDQCRDAWQAGGAAAVAKLWLRVLPDLAKTSLNEQITSRNSIMKYFTSKQIPTMLLIAGLAMGFLSFSHLIISVEGLFLLLMIGTALANAAKAGVELVRPANEWPLIWLRTFVLMFFYALFMPAWAKEKMQAPLSPVAHDYFGFFLVSCLMVNPLVAAIKFAQFFVERRRR